MSLVRFADIQLCRSRGDHFRSIRSGRDSCCRSGAALLLPTPHPNAQLPRGRYAPVPSCVRLPRNVSPELLFTNTPPLKFRGCGAVHAWPFVLPQANAPHQADPPPIHKASLKRDREDSASTHARETRMASFLPLLFIHGSCSSTTTDTHQVVTPDSPPAPPSSQGEMPQIGARAGGRGRRHRRCSPPRRCDSR